MGYVIMQSEIFSRRFAGLVLDRFGGRYTSSKKGVTSFVSEFSAFLKKDASENDSSEKDAFGRIEYNVKKWASGTVPQTETLIQLARFFHVSTDYLLGLSEEEADYNEKFIHDYLHLGFAAIQRLKEYDNETCIDMLNRLICNDVDLLRAMLLYFLEYAINYSSSSVKVKNLYTETEINYDYKEANQMLESSCLLAVSDVLFQVKNLYKEDREKIRENKMLLLRLKSQIEQLSAKNEKE